MAFPIFDLNTPTELFLHWGWLLVTRANAVIFLLVVVVFLLGIFVRVPGARRDIERVEAQAPLARSLRESGDDR